MQVAASNEIDAQLGVQSHVGISPQRTNGQGFYEQQASTGPSIMRQQPIAGHGNPGGPPAPQRGYAVFPNMDMAWRGQGQGQPHANSGERGCLVKKAAFPNQLIAGIVQTPMRQRTGNMPGSALNMAPRAAATTPVIHGPSRLRDFTRPGSGGRNIGVGSGMAAVMVGHPDGPGGKASLVSRW
jgi:hypothetical protein